MDVPIPLTDDLDGFVRRECPSCIREFKWHSGPTASTPRDWVEPARYWCPLCGMAAAKDQWWTPAQLEYKDAVLSVAAHDMMVEEVEKQFKKMKGFTFKSNPNADRPPVPSPMTEPNDMTQIESPCHPWEPVKVPDDSAAPYYCLMCGEAYAV